MAYAWEKTNTCAYLKLLKTSKNVKLTFRSCLIFFKFINLIKRGPEHDDHVHDDVFTKQKQLQEHKKPKLQTPPEHHADKQRQVVSYKLQDRAARGNLTTNIPLVQARHPHVSRSFW